MIIDKNKIKTQDELDEPAPIEEADARAKAKMKQLSSKAKKDVAEGLQSKGSAKDKEGKRNLKTSQKRS
jgi:hypothetical protein